MGIRFDVIEKSLCATDGHRLAYIPEKAFEIDSPEMWKDSELIIQFSSAALRKISKKIKVLELEIDSPRVKYCDQVIGCIIDGTYPPFKHLFPKEGSEEKLSEIGINPNLLKDFYVNKSTTYCEGVELTFYGEDKPIKVYIPAMPEVKGLIMPMRIRR
jgi:DNA polymerase III sliding clamp (beta) subunit (PCNA family)